MSVYRLTRELVFPHPEMAEEDGILVGFIQMYPTFSSVSMMKDMIMNDLYVFPGSRGKGIGKDLLETAKKFAVTLLYWTDEGGPIFWRKSAGEAFSGLGTDLTVRSDR